MIKYNLLCKCGKNFESWFSTSKEFESLKKKETHKLYLLQFYIYKKIHYVSKFNKQI